MDILGCKRIKHSCICDVQTALEIAKMTKKNGKLVNKGAANKRYTYESDNIEIDMITEFDEKREKVKTSIAISNMVVFVAISVTSSKHGGTTINHGSYSGLGDIELTALIVHDMSFREIDSLMNENGFKKISNSTFAELFDISD